MPEGIGAAAAGADNARGRTGFLRLAVARAGSRSVPADQFHSGALRILRPLYLDGTGEVTYAIINPGGGYLGGDSYRLDVEAREGSELRLRTQAATKIYRCPDLPATQLMRLTVGEGASLESLPDPVIVYRDGAYRQRTVVSCAPSSSIALADICTSGWSPTGRRFPWRELFLDTELWVGGQLELIDRQLLNPTLGLRRPAIMGEWTHAGTLLLAGPDLPRVAERIRETLVAHSEGSGGSCTVRAGMTWTRRRRALVIRSLAVLTSAITALHADIINLRRAERGARPLPGRL